MKRKVLVINSYAGSLLVGARQAECDVIASYEDSGYGEKIQRANFPEVDYRATTAAWDQKADLRGSLVIAHPPCAAFSAQLSDKKRYKDKIGLEAAKFKQTEVVVDYALSHRCDALAVESVCGAYAGARHVHEEFAKRHKYGLVHLLLNAASFGVPQWRPRYWAIYVNKRSREALPIQFNERRATLSSVLEKPFKGPMVSLNRLDDQVRKLISFAGAADTRALLRGKYGYGGLRNILLRRARTNGDLKRTREEILNGIFSGGYTSKGLVVLDPKSYAPTLLGGVLWTTNGRGLSALEYTRLMGFPDNYQFLCGDLSRQTFLARGVCPPVAAWVLEQLKGAKRPTRLAQFGETIDLRPKRGAWASMEVAS